VTLTFDLLTLKLVRNVARVRGYPTANFGDTTTTIRFRLMGYWTTHSDWSRDIVTLIFDLGGLGACGWCGSSSSIRVLSLKFVGLAIRNIWRTMCVSINGPGDLDLWAFDLETGVRVTSKVGNLSSKFWHARPLNSRIIRYVRHGRTDKSNAYCPLPYGGGCTITLDRRPLNMGTAVNSFSVWTQSGYNYFRFRWRFVISVSGVRRCQMFWGPIFEKS